jgi:hypothetical protein
MDQPTDVCLIDVARCITDTNRSSFAQELQTLRSRSTQIDTLQKENDRLRQELEACLEELEVAKGRREEEPKLKDFGQHPSSAAKNLRHVIKRYSTPPHQAGRASSANATPARYPAPLSAATSFSSKDGDAGLHLAPLEHTQLDISGDKEELIRKHAATVEAWKTARSVVEELQTKLRQSQKNEKRWIKYVEHLQKGDKQPSAKTRISAKATDWREEETERSKSSDDDGIEFIDVSDAARHEPPFIPILDTTTASDEGANLEVPERRQTPNYSNLYSVHISDSQPSLPKISCHGQTGQSSKNNQDSGGHYSSSTQSDNEVAQVNATQIDAPVSVIKEESPETPIVVSARSVKKRNIREVDNRPFSKVTIKSENAIGSSPIGLSRLEFISPNECVDLDDIGQKIDTPKKRRQMLEAHLATEYIQDKTCDLPKAGPPNRVGLARAKGISTALQPRSPNKQILPRTTNAARSEKRRKTEDRLRGAALLAEDDEIVDEAGSYANLQQVRSVNALGSTDRSARLIGLLEVPSPASRVLTPRRPILPSAATSKSVRTSNHGSTPSAYSSAAKKYPGKTADEVAMLEAIDPDHEPFRARPLKKLAMEHFKVNPDYNQGYDFAFSDVVRGREERKCLPGCTKPECCGTKFRKMAEYLRPEEVTCSQEVRDQQILDEYMGDEKGKLVLMSKTERYELLLQAQAKELSKRHGKHRHAYERRKSPPGFWRADFPTTQEQATDRAEAHKFERELVQKRYEEAMRGNGAYIFRDE